MSETLGLVLSLASGILLGAFFFGGLWWTVRYGLSSPNPGLWFIGSMLLRISAVMTGFYFLLGLPGESWQILLAGLLGFVITRLVATRLAGMGKPDLDHLERKASHAP
ncbi:ATP synthase subunit I [Nitrosospira sp. Nsp1]|uniref:ATP synthase subunit I n=1 Tax=Nitrosospira sp. Nsp1 TaxID=136547 RepID=UPI0008881960|nr:ATP synthase subunit I [Nitrosospira sp. Nsp1]SCX60808.1 F1/F0 ATPase, subunit 2 [Nitrosospira sp. Nsp1]